MEIVLCGRNVEVPQHFREHVAEKLGRVERYDHKIISVDVELSHEPNPRRSKNCQRVEITGRGRGPVVRSEGSASDFYCALDQALARLESRLRRAHDRRRVHRGRRAPLSVAQATAVEGEIDGPGGVATLAPASDTWAEHDHDGDEWAVPTARTAPEDLDGDLAEDRDEHRPGQVVRRKEHHAIPMTVDDALSQMELVGHDFFLFSDAETGRPSVVYRRHGYDYGVIALA